MTSADLVFAGGSVFTGIGQPLRDSAVAVTGERITGVIGTDELTTVIGPHTTVVDLGGGMVSPSFQDAHIHPVGGGVEMLQCDLSQAVDAQSALKAISHYAQSHLDEMWILGGGWSMDHFPGGAPDRRSLDAVTGDRPALLSSRDHHSVWANTAAIGVAGIEAETTDPRDGRIEREPDGFPAGTFHEGAEALFAEVRPKVPEDQAYAGLLAAQDALFAVGITGWQDAMVGKVVSGIEDIDAVYRRAVAAGTLRAHVRGSLWWDRLRGLEQIEQLCAVRDRARTAGLHPAYVPGTVKIMLDGVAENFTAAMLSPYHDHSGAPSVNSGLSFIAPEELDRVVTALDAAGFQVHFHSLGDRAVREALDALTAARAANGTNDNRHHLAHLQMIAEEDVPRFAELGAAANIQALWATHEEQLDELTLPFLGPDAEARHYPFGDLRRAGTTLAAGSDWPVSSPDPLLALFTAVNRRTPGSLLPPLGGEGQSVDVVTYLEACTSGSAWLNHCDDETGRIVSGHLADLVVLGTDPTMIPAERLDAVSLTSTWVRGHCVHTKE